MRCKTDLFQCRSQSFPSYTARDGQRCGVGEVRKRRPLFLAIDRSARMWAYWVAAPFQFYMHCAQVLGRRALIGCGNGTMRAGEKHGADEVSTGSYYLLAIKRWAEMQAYWPIWPYSFCLRCEQDGSKRAFSGYGCTTGRDGRKCKTDEVSKDKDLFFGGGCMC